MDVMIQSVLAAGGGEPLDLDGIRDLDVPVGQLELARTKRAPFIDLDDGADGVAVAIHPGNERPKGVGVGAPSHASWLPAAATPFRFHEWSLCPERDPGCGAVPEPVVALSLQTTRKRPPDRPRGQLSRPPAMAPRRACSRQRRITIATERRRS